MKKSCAIPKSMFPLKFKVKSPSHALELARGLIRPFRNWTTNNLATRRLDGDDECKVSPKSAKAEAFCALGALNRVNSRYQKKAELYLRRAALFIQDVKDDPEPSQYEIFNVNDDDGDKANHRRVLKMFARAIKLAKKDEKK